MLHITYYILHITYYILHITYYILHITYYILHFFSARSFLPHEGLKGGSGVGREDPPSRLRTTTSCSKCSSICCPSSSHLIVRASAGLPSAVPQGLEKIGGRLRSRHMFQKFTAECSKIQAQIVGQRETTSGRSFHCPLSTCSAGGGGGGGGNGGWASGHFRSSSVKATQKSYEWQCFKMLMEGDGRRWDPTIPMRGGEAYGSIDRPPAFGRPQTRICRCPSWSPCTNSQGWLLLGYRSAQSTERRPSVPSGSGLRVIAYPWVQLSPMSNGRTCYAHGQRL